MMATTETNLVYDIVQRQRQSLFSDWVDSESGKRTCYTMFYCEFCSHTWLAKFERANRPNLTQAGGRFAILMMNQASKECPHADAFFEQVVTQEFVEFVK